MSSGIGRMINKGSMEGSTSSPTIRVEIYNQTYNIRSDGDTEYIIQLAEFVDSRMREISSGTLTVDSLKVAILAALHIADELHRLKNMHEQADAQLGARSAECAEMLDRLLKVRSNLELEQGGAGKLTSVSHKDFLATKRHIKHKKRALILLSFFLCILCFFVARGKCFLVARYATIRGGGGSRSAVFVTELR